MAAMPIGVLGRDGMISFDAVVFWPSRLLKKSLAFSDEA